MYCIQDLRPHTKKGIGKKLLLENKSILLHNIYTLKLQSQQNYMQRYMLHSIYNIRNINEITFTRTKTAKI